MAPAGEGIGSGVIAFALEGAEPLLFVTVSDDLVARGLSAARLVQEAVAPIEKEFVLEALQRNDWNVSRAAEDTGMHRPNFQAMLKKLNISVRDRRT